MTALTLKSLRAARSVSSLRRAKANATIERNLAAEREALRATAASPVETARRFLQRRGFSVYRANVVGGPADRWAVDRPSNQMDDAGLLELAKRKGFA